MDSLPTLSKTEPSADLGLFPPRRAAAGTRCDAGRARFLRADTGSPQPHARPARVSCTHVRARAGTLHPQPGAALATVVGHGR